MELPNRPHSGKCFFGPDDTASIDLTGVEDFLALRTLTIFKYKITSLLDIGNNPNLRRLYLGESTLNSLDIYNHPSIEEVEIDGARIPEINIINNPNLLDMYSNDLRVDELILSGNPSFKTFRFMDLTITDISITNNVNLVSFGGEGFSYTGDLDLSSNQNLERISVIASGSEFKSLKTSSLTKLKVILLSNPFLSTMDFTDNAQLETLIILGSLITSLDAASKPNLVELDFRGPNNICIKVSQDQLDNIPIGWTKDPDDVYSLSCE